MKTYQHTTMNRCFMQRKWYCTPCVRIPIGFTNLLPNSNFNRDQHKDLFKANENVLYAIILCESGPDKRSQGHLHA